MEFGLWSSITECRHSQLNRDASFQKQCPDSSGQSIGLTVNSSHKDNWTFNWIKINSQSRCLDYARFTECITTTAIEQEIITPTEGTVLLWNSCSNPKPQKAWVSLTLIVIRTLAGIKAPSTTTRHTASFKKHSVRKWKVISLQFLLRKHISHTNARTHTQS